MGGGSEGGRHVQPSSHLQGTAAELVLAKKASPSARGLRINLHHKDAAFHYIPDKPRWAYCLFRWALRVCKP